MKRKFSLNSQYDWVASNPIESTTCNSPHELLQQISDISNTLTTTETFIDVDLTNVEQNLSKSIDVAPPQLTPALNELKEVVSRYTASAAQLKLNATNARFNSTHDFISSDRKMGNAIEQHLDYFDDQTKLAAACASIDSARTATAIFTENVAERYKKLKTTLMPNEDEIIAALAELIRKLNEPTLTDFDAIANSVPAVIQEIQVECDRIEQNIHAETIDFGHFTDDAAFKLEWTLNILAESVYKLLPDSVNEYDSRPSTIEGN